MFPQHWKLDEANPDTGAGAPPAPAPAPASSESDVQWDEFIADGGEEDFDDNPPTDSPDNPPASQDNPPAEPPASAQPPVATQPPAAPPAQQPPASAPQPAAPPVAPTAEQQAQREQQIAQARAAMRDQLADIYVRELDEDTKTALIADPAAVLPKLLAQAALDGANLAMHQMMPVLPQVVHQATSQQQATTQAWQEFNATAPDLAKPEYRKAVVSAIQFVKGSGVQYATKQDAMAAVARATRAMLGLPQPGMAVVQQPPVAPVAPHTPVARGAARQPASKANAKDNPWLEMIDD